MGVTDNYLNKKIKWRNTNKISKKTEIIQRFGIRRRRILGQQPNWMQFTPHVPVARGASLSRGITDEGHGGGIAYFTSIEYLILQ